MRIPESPPKMDSLWAKISSERLLNIWLARNPEPGGRYHHWDKIRRLKPPAPLTSEEWWVAIKMARSGARQVAGFHDRDGHPFFYVVPDAAQRMLHRIDRDAGGVLSSLEPLQDPRTREVYLVNSLMEEAITSSQLEGAATTREQAAQMLRSGRPPATHGEKMVLNNYRAITRIRELEGPLTPEQVLELHYTLVEGTLKERDGAGRLRHEREKIAIYDEEGQLLHSPPIASSLPKRMAEMCSFANGDSATGDFVHPAIRAILLHFRLAYDHPFVDGNGRAARALFFWAMRRYGYWLTELRPISRLLRQAPTRYARSFLYVETDENDLTYFILDQLETLCRAIDDLGKYIERKRAELVTTRELLKRSVSLNHRQHALLSHALRHPGTEYTIEAHRRSHLIVYQTSRADLYDLARRGLLERLKKGRTFFFVAPDDLAARLRKLA